MITILLIAITWYATKIYYTGDPKINIPGLADHGLITAKCSRCAQHMVIREEDLRTPFYCIVCK
jgi:exosome complex RNA-binding protein Csl4